MADIRAVKRVLRDNAVAAAWAVAGLLTLAWLGLYDFAWNDYDTEASASVHALVHGHFLAFLREAPSYGGSLLVRAPFALAPDLWGGGALADYRMLALPCLAAAGGLGLWLVAHLRAAGRGRLARATVLGLLVANPVMLYALEIGHAEEILAGALCVAALLGATSGSAAWAGLLVGLAVATKSWALVAVLPVVVALPDRRWRALLVATGVAAAGLLPFLLVQRLSGHGGAGVTVEGTGIIFQPQQLWWFLGSHHLVVNSHGKVMVGFRAAPHWISLISHPSVVLVSVPLSLLWLRRRKGRPWEALGLLTLVLLLRCLLDTWDNYYYLVPFLFSLTAWEGLARRQPPLLSLAATTAAWLCFQRLPTYLSPDGQAAAFLLWTVPAALAIGVWLYAPRTFARAQAALSRPVRRTVSARLAGDAAPSRP